jgi:hypothetical protein
MTAATVEDIADKHKRYKVQPSFVQGKSAVSNRHGDLGAVARRYRTHTIVSGSGSNSSAECSYRTIAGHGHISIAALTMTHAAAASEDWAIAQVGTQSVTDEEHQRKDDRRVVIAAALLLLSFPIMVYDFLLGTVLGMPAFAYLLAVSRAK